MYKEIEILKENYDLIKNLLVYCKEILGYETHPNLVFLINNEVANNPIGKTAYYLPNEHKVCVYILNRHLNDVIKSITHEIIHYNQDLRGEFENSGPTTNGYAQKDQPLRKLEEEAYLKGNMIARDFKDKIVNGEIKIKKSKRS